MSEGKDNNFHAVECSYRNFQRSIAISHVKADTMNAEFKDSLLKIKIEKNKIHETLKKILIK